MKHQRGSSSEQLAHELCSGTIYHLEAKYLTEVSKIIHENNLSKDLPDGGAHRSKARMIATELAMKFLERNGMSLTMNCFKNEYPTNSSRKLDSATLLNMVALKDKKEPLAELIDIMQNTNRHHYHHPKLAQALLSKVPHLLNEETKAHFNKILAKASAAKDNPPAKQKVEQEKQDDGKVKKSSKSKKKRTSDHGDSASYDLISQSFEMPHDQLSPINKISKKSSDNEDSSSSSSSPRLSSDDFANSPDHKEGVEINTSGSPIPLKGEYIDQQGQIKTKIKQPILIYNGDSTEDSQGNPKKPQNILLNINLSFNKDGKNIVANIGDSPEINKSESSKEYVYEYEEEDESEPISQKSIGSKKSIEQRKPEIPAENHFIERGLKFPSSTQQSESSSVSKASSIKSKQSSKSQSKPQQQTQQPIKQQTKQPEKAEKKAKKSKIMKPLIQSADQPVVRTSLPPNYNRYASSDSSDEDDKATAQVSTPTSAKPASKSPSPKLYQITATAVLLPDGDEYRKISSSNGTNASEEEEEEEEFSPLRPYKREIPQKKQCISSSSSSSSSSAPLSPSFSPKSPPATSFGTEIRNSNVIVEEEDNQENVEIRNEEEEEYDNEEEEIENNENINDEDEEEEINEEPAPKVEQVQTREQNIENQEETTKPGRRRGRRGRKANNTNPDGKPTKKGRGRPRRGRRKGKRGSKKAAEAKPQYVSTEVQAKLSEISTATFGPDNSSSSPEPSPKRIPCASRSPKQLFPPRSPEKFIKSPKKNFEESSTNVSQVGSTSLSSLPFINAIRERNINTLSSSDDDSLFENFVFSDLNRKDHDIEQSTSTMMSSATNTTTADLSLAGDFAPKNRGVKPMSKTLANLLNYRKNLLSEESTLMTIDEPEEEEEKPVEPNEPKKQQLGIFMLDTFQKGMTSSLIKVSGKNSPSPSTPSSSPPINTDVATTATSNYSPISSSQSSQFTESSPTSSYSSKVESSNTVTETESESEIESDSEYQSESDSRVKSKSKLKSKSKSKSKTETETESETQSETESETQSESRSESPAETETQSSYSQSESESELSASDSSETYSSLSESKSESESSEISPKKITTRSGTVQHTPKSKLKPANWSATETESSGKKSSSKRSSHETTSESSSSQKTDSDYEISSSKKSKTSEIPNESSKSHSSSRKSAKSAVVKSKKDKSFPIEPELRRKSVQIGALKKKSRIENEETSPDDQSSSTRSDIDKDSKTAMPKTLSSGDKKKEKMMLKNRNAKLSEDEEEKESETESEASSKSSEEIPEYETTESETESQQYSTSKDYSTTKRSSTSKEYSTTKGYSSSTKDNTTTEKETDESSRNSSSNEETTSASPVFNKKPPLKNVRKDDSSSIPTSFADRDYPDAVIDSIKAKTSPDRERRDSFDTTSKSQKSKSNRSSTTNTEYSSSAKESSTTGKQYSTSSRVYSTSRKEYSTTGNESTTSEAESSTSEPEYSTSKRDYSTSKRDYSSSKKDYSTTTSKEYSTSRKDYSSSKKGYSTTSYASDTSEKESSSPSYSGSKKEYSTSRRDDSTTVNEPSTSENEYSTSKKEYSSSRNESSVTNSKNKKAKQESTSYGQSSYTESTYVSSSNDESTDDSYEPTSSSAPPKKTRKPKNKKKQSREYSTSDNESYEQTTSTAASSVKKPDKRQAKRKSVPNEYSSSDDDSYYSSYYYSSSDSSPRNKKKGQTNDDEYYSSLYYSTETETLEEPPRKNQIRLRVDKAQFEQLYPNGVKTPTIILSKKGFEVISNMIQNRDVPIDLTPKSPAVQPQQEEPPASPSKTKKRVKKFEAGHTKNEPNTMTIVTSGPHAGLIKRKIKKSDHKADIEKKLHEKEEIAKKLQDELDKIKEKENLKVEKATETPRVEIATETFTPAKNATPRRAGKATPSRKRSPQKRSNAIAASKQLRQQYINHLMNGEELSSITETVSISVDSELHPEMMTREQKRAKRKEIHEKIKKLREELTKPVDVDARRRKRAKIEAKIEFLRNEFEKSSDSEEKLFMGRKLESKMKKLHENLNDPTSLTPAQRRKRRHEIEQELQKLHDELDMTTSTDDEQLNEQQQRQPLPRRKGALKGTKKGKMAKKFPPKQQNFKQVLKGNPKKFHKSEDEPDVAVKTRSAKINPKKGDDQNSYDKEFELNSPKIPVRVELKDPGTQKVEKPSSSSDSDNEFENEEELKSYSYSNKISTPPTSTISKSQTDTKSSSQNEEKAPHILNEDFFSDSSISERRKIPPLTVEIPKKDGKAEFFKKHYESRSNTSGDNLMSSSSSENELVQNNKNNQRNMLRGPEYKPQQIRVKKREMPKPDEVEIRPPKTDNNTGLPIPPPNASISLSQLNISPSGSLGPIMFPSPPPQPNIQQLHYLQSTQPPQQVSQPVQLQSQQHHNKVKRKYKVSKRDGSRSPSPIKSDDQKKQVLMAPPPPNGQDQIVIKDGKRKIKRKVATPPKKDEKSLSSGSNSKKEHKYPAESPPSSIIASSNKSSKSSFDKKSSYEESLEKASHKDFLDDVLGHSNEEDESEMTFSTSSSSSNKTPSRVLNKYNVVIKVIEATDVPNIDAFDDCDPYCLLFIEGDTSAKRTKAQEKTSHPIWNEEFVFTVNDSSAALIVQLKDEDIAAGDEILSTAKIDLLKFQADTNIDQWFNMKAVTGDSNGGKVHMIIKRSLIGTSSCSTDSLPQNNQQKNQLNNQSHNHTNHQSSSEGLKVDEKTMPKLRLNVSIEQGKGLPNCTQYCVAKIRATEGLAKTRPLNSSEPGWNESFKLKLPDPKNDSLLVTLRTRDPKNGDDDIANCTIPVSSIPFGQSVDQWFEFKSIGAKPKVIGSIHMKLRTELDSDNDTLQFSTSSSNMLTDEKQRLEINIIEGKEFKSGSSAYVMARIEGDPETFRTRTITDTRSPKWNEKFGIAVDPNKDILTIKIRNSKDDSDIASTQINLGGLKLKPQQIISKWFNLSPEGSGKLRIGFHFDDISPLSGEFVPQGNKFENFIENNIDLTTLSVDIVEARNIPKSSPFCLVTLEGGVTQQVLQTRAIRPSIQPKWNQHLEFQLAPKASATLIVIIKDKRSNDREIGQISLPIKSLKSGVSNDKWFKLEPSGEIHLIVTPNAKDSPKPIKFHTSRSNSSKNQKSGENTNSSDVDEPVILVDASSSESDIDFSLSEEGIPMKKRRRKKKIELSHSKSNSNSISSQTKNKIRVKKRKSVSSNSKNEDIENVLERNINIENSSSVSSTESHKRKILAQFPSSSYSDAPF